MTKPDMVWLLAGLLRAQDPWPMDAGDSDVALSASCVRRAELALDRTWVFVEGLAPK